MSLIPKFAVLAVVAAFFSVTRAEPTTRLVGGEESHVGEFPFQVSIRKNGHHECGGTIISKRHILTAAHCIDGGDPLKDLTIVTGTNSLMPGAGVTHAIKSYAIHANYSNKAKDSWRNDVAVIELTKDIAFDMVTRPAKLPKDDIKPNSTCTVSGWGRTSWPKGTSPYNIRKAETTTLDIEDCRQRYYSMQIFESHVCVYASAGVGICSGDSGGGLIHDGEVHGIASFAIPCGKGVPDVFTRVHYFLDFIKKHIGSG